MKVLSRLGVMLPKNVIKILRMMSCRGEGVVHLEGSFIHNFGDFFLYGNYTIIKVYRCEKQPHVLLLFVSPRIAFIELIW